MQRQLIQVPFENLRRYETQLEYHAVQVDTHLQRYVAWKQDYNELQREMEQAKTEAIEGLRRDIIIGGDENNIDFASVLDLPPGVSFAYILQLCQRHEHATKRRRD